MMREIQDQYSDTKKAGDQFGPVTSLVERAATLANSRAHAPEPFLFYAPALEQTAFVPASLSSMGIAPTRERGSVGASGERLRRS